jgi:3-hydroxyisobutyrate dehydrogenase-like beta-hydroxyacid dehydrogenase
VTLLAEAAACAARGQVAPEVFVDVLATGGGGGTALERIKPYLLAGDSSGLRFSIANACKDLGYYAAMAHDAGAVHDVAAAVLATLEAARGRSAPGTWLPELVDILARPAG